MQVGTTKDQGVYNKPSDAVHPGALAAGTLPQYNTIYLERLSLSFPIQISRNALAPFLPTFINIGISLNVTKYPQSTLPSL